MVKTYRAVQQWNHWLTNCLGERILAIETNFLSSLLQRNRSHALLIGVPNQNNLFKSSHLTNRIILSPLINKNKYIKYIESEYYELPLMSGSIDLVLVPHTLELIDNPHQLLLEACRVVKPGGEIIIFGFNPFSLFGLKKWWMNHKEIPWSHHFISPHTVKKWLALADFELIKQNMLFYRPPIEKNLIYKKLKFMEWMGHKFHAPWGNIYVLIAKANMLPLTPIKLHWKQTLPALTTPMPGSSMRDMQ